MAERSGASSRQLHHEDGVEHDDDGDDRPTGDAGAGGAGKGLHDRAAAGKDEQGDKSGGEGEAEDDLREGDDPKRLEAHGDDEEGGDDGDEAAEEDGELDIEEAFDDDLAGQDADGGGGQAGAEEGDGEGGCGERAEERAEGVMGDLDVVDDDAVGKGDGGHDEHGGVDEPGAVHGGEDVDEFEAEEAEAGSFSRAAAARGTGRSVGCGEFFETGLDECRVEIDDVGHDGCAEHADGEVDALVEAR